MHDAVRTTSIATLNRKIAVVGSDRKRQGRKVYAGEYRRIESEAEPTHRHGLPEQRVQREPDGQVENDHDDGGRYSGERACERLVAAQLFDVRRTEEDPEEARRERHPGGEQGARVAASSGESPPASRNAAMNATNWTTMISGPGVVSAMPNRRASRAAGPSDSSPRPAGRRRPAPRKRRRT
jgi:hypothetical protein